MPTLADDPLAAQLKERLTSLHDHCLTDLARGLRATRDAESAIADYNAMREDLRAALGDRSICTTSSRA